MGVNYNVLKPPKRARDYVPCACPRHCEILKPVRCLGCGRDRGCQTKWTKVRAESTVCPDCEDARERVRIEQREAELNEEREEQNAMKVVSDEKLRATMDEVEEELGQIEAAGKALSEGPDLMVGDEGESRSECSNCTGCGCNRTEPAGESDEIMESAKLTYGRLARQINVESVAGHLRTAKDAVAVGALFTIAALPCHLLCQRKWGAHHPACAAGVAEQALWTLDRLSMREDNEE